MTVDEAEAAGEPAGPGRSDGAEAAAARLRPLPWGRLVLLALLGTLLGTALALVDLDRTRATNGGLAHTGPDGPAAELMAQDFPDEPQFTYGEHDGPMFYAIARDPWDLDVVTESLDRPRYRLQHPLFSWLAWAANPFADGGDDLLWTLFGVGVASMALAGVSVGALSHTLRGPVWLAAVVPILPGATVSLRITVADTLAVALLAAALAASLRGRPVLAAALGVAAVLTKEPMILGLGGLFLWRRDRDGAILVGAPVVVAGAWALFLRSRVESPGGEVIEFGLPFAGLTEAITDIWAQGDSPYALVSVAAAFGFGIAALVRRRPAHPLWWAVAANLAFVTLLTTTVVGLERNGTRMTMPLLVLGLVTALAPSGRAQVPEAVVPARRWWPRPHPGGPSGTAERSATSSS